MEQFEKRELHPALHKAFVRTEIGYDANEVDKHLKHCYAELDRRQAEIERLKAELRGANDGIDPDDPFDGDIPWRHEIDNGESEVSDEH